MDPRKIGRWLSSVTLQIVTVTILFLNQKKKKKPCRCPVPLFEGVIEDLWMDVGGMTLNLKLTYDQTANIKHWGENLTKTTF